MLRLENAPEDTTSISTAWLPWSSLHPYLVHYFDSSQPAGPAGRFRKIWPQGFLKEKRD